MNDYIIKAFEKIKVECLRTSTTIFDYLKKYERDVEIYGDCKDGSGSQVRYHLHKFKEYFSEELNV